MQNSILKSVQATCQKVRLSILVIYSIILLFTCSIANAQALQWSQYVGHKDQQNPAAQSRSFGSRVEKAPDGSLYVLGSVRKPSVQPTYTTTDVKGYGLLAGDGIGLQLSKYNNDGKLLWVRYITTGGGINTNLMGLSVNANSEAQILYRSPRHLPDVLTANAYQSIHQSVNTVCFNKFNAAGDLTYGTYLGPANGDLVLPTVSATGSNPGSNFDNLYTAPDGTTYMSFLVQRTGTQTGSMPITPATAFQTDFDATASTKTAMVVMIFKPNNTLQYSSLFNYNGNLDNNTAMNAAGDLYVLMSGTGLGVMPPTTSGAFSASELPSGKSYIMRFNTSGVITASSYVEGVNSQIAIDPTTNDVVIMHSNNGTVQVYNAGLTTQKSKTTPFGTGLLGTTKKIVVDNAGKLHVAISAANGLPITTGALRSSPDPGIMYYGIADCSLTKTIYGTYIPSMGGGLANLNDIAVDANCNAYLTGTVGLGSIDTYKPFPVTPVAYNDNGTGTTTGYNLTPTSQDFLRNGESGYLMKFNYPKFKANTNQITAPAITTFCVDGGVLPIQGTPAKYLTPNLLGFADANPAPVPTHYKWQRASSASGPWTDLPESDLEDFSPAVPATAGTYFFRRLVRQTPFDIADACVNTCDPIEVSNVISLTFSADKSHKTDLTDKTYGFCKGGSLAVTANIVPSADGSQGPYAYKLTSLTDLSTVLMGQSGTKAAAPAAIGLTITQAGQFLLQVTDARNCTSFDTLTVEYFKLNVGSRIQFTCGNSSLVLGPGSPPSEYANIPNNTISWSPTTNLSNASILSPTVTSVPAPGASVDYRVSLNGCPVDTVTVTNEVVAPLPTLPDIMRCQGDTATLGQGLVAQTGVSYEWAPGFGLTSTTAMQPIVTTASAPAGVNETIYTVKAQNGLTGCPQYTTQKVTVYRTPNQSFSVFDCMKNGCYTDSVLKYRQFGTPAEPGISYTWTATVVDDPTNVGTTGLPTNAQALAFLSSPSASQVTLNAGTTTMGRASKYGYKIIYVRKSFNTADPTCMRSDTATLYYCCGSGTMCALSLGALPTVSCGGVNNKIGPIQYSSGGTYIWSRLDGQPLNNELFDVVTQLPLTNGGPHPNQVIANPSGLTAIDYRLTLIGGGDDTCRIDIKVFPSTSAKPNVTYVSPQAVCQGNPYTIQGAAANPAYTYFWESKDILFTPADSAKALPKLKGFDSNTSAYVTVTDPSTGCFVKDTVDLVVSPVVVNAGDNATFCQSGATVDIGATAGLSGYTYQWTAVPATGVSFASATSAQTTATLPATAVNGKIILYLTATNGQTSANCSLKDSVILTSSAAPTVSLGAVNRLCTGGEIALGLSNPISSSYDYLWTGPGIVGSATGSSIKVNAVGTYEVTVSQGTCSTTTPVTVSATVNPTVTPNPASLCSGAATIGVNNSPDGGWTYSWDKFDGLKGYETDFSTISVEPTVATTYTLTATHVSGCVLTFPIAVPAAAYSADLPSTLVFCEGNPAILPLNAPPSGSTVAWTATPASALAYLSSTTATQPSINMTSAVAGTYYFKATVTYGTGCTSTDSVKVAIGKKRENIAGFDQEICKGTCTNLGITALSGVVYEWSANPADSTLTTLFSAKPKVCPTQNTTYTVKYFDASGCIFTDDVVVKILPTPTLEVKDLDACQNATGTATVDLATSIVSTTGTTNTYWLNATATIAAVNPVKSSGTYYVKTADAICYAILPVNVLINEPPVGVIETSYSCESASGLIRFSSFTANARADYSIGASYTGSKTYANATVLGATGLVASGVAANTYTVRLFGADSTCFKDYTVSLTVPAACCVTPVVGKAYGTPSRCTNGTPANDAKITVVGITNGTKYGYSLGRTYTGPAYSGATSFTGGSFIIPNLSTTAGNRYVVRIFNASNTCYKDIIVIIPHANCNNLCTIDGGPDQLLCGPTTTVDLVDATASQEWVAGLFNPTPATINASTGVVSGISVDGIYSFILQDKVTTTCFDEIFVFRGVAELPTLSSCESSYELPTAPGGVWTSIAGGASVTAGGMITGMTNVGTYRFSVTFGGCTSTVSVEKIDCPCVTPDAGADAAICLPKTGANLTDAPSGYTWVVGSGNPVGATINAATGLVSGMTASGTYSFRLQSTSDVTCFDELQITVSNGDVPIILCDNGSTSYSLVAPANLINVVWYNMANTQVGTGNTLTVTSNTTGLSDGTEAFYYIGEDGTASGCDVELCCPVKFLTQTCCPTPNCATITVIKN